jgi:hypothetical protein
MPVTGEIIIIIIIIIIKGQLKPSQNNSQNTSATNLQSTTSMNYIKQPYWALHTYCGKY